MRQSPLRLRFALVIGAAVALAACARRAAESSDHAAQPAHAATSPDHARPHWDYGPEHGPAKWASLEPEFAICDTGNRQSPIDIPASTTAEAAGSPVRLEIVRHERVAEVTNNGHTIQVNDAGADILTIGEETYALLQYHFHSPSENTVSGQHHPMEMHLVHKSAAGNLAVLAVFIREGTENAAFALVWAHLPKQTGAVSALERAAGNVGKMLPKDWTAWRFDGSLTTPPCGEGVKWLVFRDPVALSADQIEAFRAVIDGNNRPTQPLEGRPIVLGRVLPAASH